MDGYTNRKLVFWALLTHLSGMQLQWLGVVYGELLEEQERQEEPWLHRGSRCQAVRPGPKPCISIMSPASEGRKGSTSVPDKPPPPQAPFSMPTSVPRAAA
jgi:hypothetical protein